MQFNELNEFVKNRFEKVVAHDLHTQKPEAIAVAFPQTLPPGFNHYVLESANNRQSIGIAAATVVEPQGTAIVLARFGEDTLKVEFPARRIEFPSGSRVLEVSIMCNGAHLFTWEGCRAEGFRAKGTPKENTTYALEKIISQDAIWRNASNQRIKKFQFSLTLPHSPTELVKGFARGMAGLFTKTEQRNNDIICDFSCDYGVPPLALMGLILALRMNLEPYDF